MPVAVFMLSAALATGIGDPAIAGTLLQRAESEFQQGIAARDHPGQARKHFEAAWTAYEDLQRQGFTSAALLRNEGNAALLAGDLPEAILAYRQGLAVDPSDRALLESLEYARDQVEYPRSDVRAGPEGRPSSLPRASDTALLALAMGCYALACIVLTRWLMIRRVSLLAGGGLVLILACGLGFQWGTRQASVVQQREHASVVVKETSPLRIGNGPSYPPHPGLTSARRGMEGRLHFVRGDWLQVEFPGGVLGWLPRERVLLDITNYE